MDRFEIFPPPMPSRNILDNPEQKLMRLSRQETWTVSSEINARIGSGKASPGPFRFS